MAEATDKLRSDARVQDKRPRFLTYFRQRRAAAHIREPIDGPQDPDRRRLHPRQGVSDLVILDGHHSTVWFTLFCDRTAPPRTPIMPNYVDRDRCSRWATLAVLAEAVLPSVDRQRIHHGWQNKRR